MAITKSEMFTVMSKVMAAIAKAYEDDVITKAELMGIVQTAATEAFKEYVD